MLPPMPCAVRYSRATIVHCFCFGGHLTPALAVPDQAGTDQHDAGTITPVEKLVATSSDPSRSKEDRRKKFYPDAEMHLDDGTCFWLHAPGCYDKHVLYADDLERYIRTATLHTVRGYRVTLKSLVKAQSESRLEAARC